MATCETTATTLARVQSPNEVSGSSSSGSDVNGVYSRNELVLSVESTMPLLGDEPDRGPARSGHIGGSDADSSTDSVN